MSADSSQQHLIESLAAELTPVKRLRPPWLRALGWLLLVAVVAVVLLMNYGIEPMLQRMDGAPELPWATAGAVLATAGAAWAALILGVPGRSGHWAWLPVPGAVLWLAASGLGCLRHWFEPGAGMASTSVPAIHCLVFIVLASIPLSALLIWLLRRACPLRPVLSAILVGLASASASAVLLSLFHPYDVAATDLFVHALAICIVVAANALMGNRLLSPNRM